MPDNAYTNELLAGLYDPMNPWAVSDDFYLDLVMEAGSVLDAGCGTGELLCRARAAGHPGELTGLDPAAAMLALARAKRTDVTWLTGDARSFDTGRTHDLITMTGHAFQVLLTDDDVRAALAAFARHLAPGGRLAFETRNPGVRAWERWTPEHTAGTVRAPGGELYDGWCEHPVLRDGGLVDFTGVIRSRTTDRELRSPSTLRFIDPAQLRSLLTEAGFHLDAAYGHWDRSPFTPTSPELIITATRRP